MTKRVRKYPPKRVRGNAVSATTSGRKRSSVAERLDALEKLAGKDALLAIMGQHRMNPELPGHAALLAQLLNSATMRAEKAERKYAALSGKLVGLLTSDQKEAAEICGCSVEDYAIEWIELQKTRIFPNHEARIHPLNAVQGGL